jgi:hypothetical protein
MFSRSEKSRSASPKTDPKQVVDSVIPIVQESSGLPVNGLGNDLVHQAAVLAKVDHTTGPVELGPYIESEHRTGGAYHQRHDGQPLGGQSATIAFDDSYFQFFQKFTPAMRSVVIYVGQMLSGEAGNKRLYALAELLDERVEAAAARRRWRRWRHSLWVLFGGAVLFARYFVDQASWIVEKLPFFKAVWQFIIAGRA